MGNPSQYWHLVFRCSVPIIYNMSPLHNLYIFISKQRPLLKFPKNFPPFAHASAGTDPFRSRPQHNPRVSHRLTMLYFYCFLMYVPTYKTFSIIFSSDLVILKSSSITQFVICLKYFVYPIEFYKADSRILEDIYY